MQFRLFPTPGTPSLFRGTFNVTPGNKQVGYELPCDAQLLNRPYGHLLDAYRAGERSYPRDMLWLRIRWMRNGPVDSYKDAAGFREYAGKGGRSAQKSC